MLVIMFLLIICWWLCCVWKRRSLGPQPPLCLWSLPIIGNAHYLFFLSDTIKIWEVSKKLINHSLHHGGVGRVDIGPDRLYILTDPEDCLTVSNKCLRKHYVYTFLRPWLEVGLASSDPPLWKQDRNLYLSMFTQRNLKMDLLNKYSEILVDNLATHVGKNKFSPESIFKLHGLEVATEYLFGLGDENMRASNEVYHEVVEQIFDLIATRFMNPILHIPFLYNCSSLKKRFDRVTKIAADITLKRIETRRLERKKLKHNNIENTTNSDKSKPLVDILLELNEKNYAFTDNKMRDHLDTMLVGVFDTTGKSMLFTIALIGSHEDVQERIYDELQQVLGDSDRDLEREDLSKLTYLEAVIKESLRLYPPAPIIGRKASTEVKLRNYTIPRGGVHIICVYGIHRHTVWGADAEQFRPERWLEPGGVPENASAFAGFSLGNRSCIGKHYAMMLIKTAFAHILRRYRVTADISKMVLSLNTFLVPISGHEIKLELRNA